MMPVDGTVPKLCEMINFKHDLSSINDLLCLSLASN